MSRPDANERAEERAAEQVEAIVAIALALYKICDELKSIRNGLDLDRERRERNTIHLGGGG